MPQTSQPTGTMTLLRRVALRLRLARAGVWVYRGTLAAACLYVIVLLASRLTARVPDVFEPWTLLLIPAAGLLAGLLLHRGPTLRQAAEQADVATRSKDLFLTAASLEGSPGEYQALIVRDAEDKARVTSPAAVVPFNPWNRFSYAMLALLVVGGLLFLPQFDPFGEKERDDLLARKKEQLKLETEQAQRRATQLAKAQPQDHNSAPVDQKLEELLKTFQQMKKQDPAGNQQRLMEQRQLLEDAWRKKSEEQLKNSLNQGTAAQRFGGATEQSRQMKEQLQQGNPDPAKQKAEELQKKVQELQQATDPAEKQKLQQQVKQGLQEMSSMARDMGAGSLNEALSRAMQQLDTASLEGVSQEALQSLAQSLSLSQQEMESLAQSARDMQSLQQAMQTLQTAMALNKLQPLDGSQNPNSGGGQPNPNALEAYAQLYQECLSQCQGGGEIDPLGIPNLVRSGSGGGMGGPGRGRGGVAPEDPTQQMALKSEKSQSALQAGKILMQLKTKGVGEKGEVNRDYRQVVADVKQGVGEAILQEQVPPGYHEGIRGYFDTLESATPAVEAGQ